MKENDPSSRVADNDIDMTGMHLSEIAGFVKPDPGGEEVVVNEQEQDEVVNQDEDTVNGSD